MAIATSYTQAQLDALEEAMASGVLSVSTGGRTVSYRSLADMEAQAYRMRVALGLITSSNTPSVSWAKFRGVGDE